MIQESSFPYAFFERKIVPIEKAKISIMTSALQYGNAIFTGIRGYVSFNKKNLNIFRLKDHYQRFFQSLRIINKEIKYNHQELVKITVDLVKKNSPETDFYIRPIAYATNFEVVPDLHKLIFDFALYMIPLGEFLPLGRGLKLCVSNWLRINDNTIPSRAKITGGYINSSLAKMEAVRHGYDDALMLAINGHIAEASAANFFIIRDGILITSPKYADILEGITRRTIITLAHDLKIPVEEREIDRTEVYIADEAFLCGTGVQVAWVKEIDGRIIGNGERGSYTKQIQELFFDIIRGKVNKYSQWITSV